MREQGQRCTLKCPVTQMDLEAAFLEDRGKDTEEDNIIYLFIYCQ